MYETKDKHRHWSVICYKNIPKLAFIKINIMKNFDNINQTLRFYRSLVSSHFSGITFLYDVLCQSCQREKNNSKSVRQSPNMTVISENKTDFGGSSECLDALRALPLDCC